MINYGQGNTRLAGIRSRNQAVVTKLCLSVSRPMPSSAARRYMSSICPEPLRRKPSAVSQWSRTN